MNYYSKEMEKTLNRKFGDKEELEGRGQMGVPVSPEREYNRFINDYMSEFKKIFLEELPSLENDYKTELKFRVDGESEMRDKVDALIEKIDKKLDSLSNKMMMDRLMKIATQSRDISVGNWKRLIRRTLGVDITEDYYRGDLMKQLLQKWAKENVDLISTVPKDNLSRMRKIVLEGYQSGTSTREMTKEIMSAYSMSKRHARMIARDQMSKLSGSIARRQQEDVGVTRYKWSTVKDSRVRDSHRELEGKIFEWNNPPEMWHRGKGGAKIYDGRRCHPTEDYQCRCIAIPIFDKSRLSLPVESQPYNIVTTLGLILGGKK